MATTYNNLFLDTRTRLKKAGIESAQLEAREILCYAADKTREQFYRDMALYVSGELERRVEAADGLYAIDAINLFESGLDRLCDRTVAVTAPTELRVKRIMARDHITEQYARLRLNAQKQDEYYRGKCSCELKHASGLPEEFRQEARLFFERLVESVLEEKRMAASAAEHPGPAAPAP